MKLRRVVVTGLGALTPIGNTIQEYWEGLKNGVSGAAPITHFELPNLKHNLHVKLKTSTLLISLTEKRLENSISLLNML